MSAGYSLDESMACGDHLDHEDIVDWEDDTEELHVCQRCGAEWYQDKP